MLHAVADAAETVTGHVVHVMALDAALHLVFPPTGVVRFSRARDRRDVRTAASPTGAGAELGALMPAPSLASAGVVRHARVFPG